MHPQEPWSMLLLYLVLLPAILLPAAQRQDKTTWPARNPVEAAKILRYYCAACHGADGRGHGPASVALKHAVPDLTDQVLAIAQVSAAAASATARS